jgi:hypothetical protein
VRVTVKLQGAVGKLPGVTAGEAIELSLPDDSTAGCVLRELGGRLGEPFPGPDTESEAKLPASLRVFVNGELAAQPDRTPLNRGASSTNVMVIIMTPMMGGSD